MVIKKAQTLFVFLTHAEIAVIPKGRKIIYVQIVVDYCPPKDDPIECT